MKRGEIWTLQDKHYASKARPVVVIQSDKHDSFDSGNCAYSLLMNREISVQECV